MTFLRFSDEVALVLRRGLVSALPGGKWRYARNKVRYRVATAGRAVCGLIATQTMLAEIERMKIGDKLGARGRLGIMRLSIKLVALGPHERCACQRCREHRKFIEKIA